MENPAEQKSKENANDLIYIGVIVAIAFWLFDTIIDTFLFKEGDLLENLAGISHMEIWMRAAIMLMIVGFAIYAQRRILERERLISELQDAISQVRTLKGLVPICSFCKNIRDEKGIWNKVESYLSMHTDADFTHGMCPSCATNFREQTQRDD